MAIRKPRHAEEFFAERSRRVRRLQQTAAAQFGHDTIDEIRERARGDGVNNVEPVHTCFVPGLERIRDLLRRSRQELTGGA